MILNKPVGVFLNQPVHIFPCLPEEFRSRCKTMTVIRARNSKRAARSLLSSTPSKQKFAVDIYFSSGPEATMLLC
jgi:hypothetical protein